MVLTGMVFNTGTPFAFYSSTSCAFYSCTHPPTHTTFLRNQNSLSHPPTYPPTHLQPWGCLPARAWGRLIAWEEE